MLSLRRVSSEELRCDVTGTPVGGYRCRFMVFTVFKRVGELNHSSHLTRSFIERSTRSFRKAVSQMVAHVLLNIITTFCFRTEKYIYK